MIPLIPLLAVGLVAVSPASADPPSPASGHAAVVAQGLLEFGAGEHHWAVTTTPVTSTQTALGTSGPAFIVAGGEGATLVGPSSDFPEWRLSASEAVFTDGDAALDAQSVRLDGSSAIVISIVEGVGDGAFTAGEGVRDVNLVRDVLTTNEALLVATDVSAVVVVAAGAVTAGGTTITTGSHVALTGDIALFNTGPEPAVVFAAVIGPIIGEGSGPVSASIPEDSTPDAPAGPAPSATTPPPPAQTSPPQGGVDAPGTTPATTSSISATTTTDPYVDSDGDGMGDSDENEFGTDPNDIDTDDDGLDDADEILLHFTNPLAADTDGDGMGDSNEIESGTDPNDIDTDDDGLDDADEILLHFTNPLAADTDGEGMIDSDEIEYGCDPQNADTDGDNLDDFTEGQNCTNSLG